VNFHILLGQNGICTWRSSLAFLAKLLSLFLKLFLLISLKQRVVYMFMQENEQQMRKNTTNSKNREIYGVKDVVSVARIA